MGDFFSYFFEIEMHVELYGLYLSCERFFECFVGSMSILFGLIQYFVVDFFRMNR